MWMQHFILIECMLQIRVWELVTVRKILGAVICDKVIIV